MDKSSVAFRNDRQDPAEKNVGKSTLDGNEAVAAVAHKLNEVVIIYPITPSSPMGEWADTWSSQGKRNLWGTVPVVREMQSEAGAAGAVHGALQAGALTTTFTASQGLLLMMPNMYKIAGELTPTVFHVAARSLAAQALSIFGDHSDVMAARTTGFALFASSSVQEASDFAAIAQAATLESRIPFLHFFDGFRTSHEVAKIEMLSDGTLQELIDKAAIAAHRNRALSPDHPVIRGTAQNPDVYFQAREAVNPFYASCPDRVRSTMEQFAKLTGRSYHLFDYHGAADADRIIVLMGSSAETAHETVDALVREGEKVGVVKVRLYRPFDVKHFLAVLPACTRKMAVLDRTKEPGASGEPLYLDCVNAVQEAYAEKWAPFKDVPHIVGGRYGLSSKEFTPAMVKGVFDHLKQDRPRNHFTVGIQDDVSATSIPYDKDFSTEANDVYRAVFYGLGSDGTVGANKNSIKIIGDNTPHYTQGYFVYDSRKAGAMTISHLRFGPRLIRSTYLITKAQFLACHQWTFLERYDVLDHVLPGGIFLLNTPYPPDQIWHHLPKSAQETIIQKRLKCYAIDAYHVAQTCGMGPRINTVMQVCFFAIAGVLPQETAFEEIKKAIRKTYGSKGEEIIQRNIAAVDEALKHLAEIAVPEKVSSGRTMPPPVSPRAPAFVREVLGTMIAGRGDELPVGCLPADGTYPTATSQWEKRNLAQEIPVWDADVCIECGKCALVCPHAVIRIKVYDPKYLEGAPDTFRSRETRNPEWKGLRYTIQAAPEDCTGCSICVDVCPAKKKSEIHLKAINMCPQEPVRATESINWDFFLRLPEMDRRRLRTHAIRDQQVQQPLFEFSGACAGCGETPYLKLMSQLFGDRALIANATGCSSIYGGNLPTTPWSKNQEGRGPAWSNSLFEDNAEFGYGMRVALDKQVEMASELLVQLQDIVGRDLAQSILSAEQKDESDAYDQRERIQLLKFILEKQTYPGAEQLRTWADLFVKKSVWIIGGDGWGYDIGYGGLDHVLSTGANVNVLLLDTEVYSNTGGQMSKSTPRAAVAKFAAGGKPTAKKDLGLMAMTYGHVYVASVAMGARDEHTLKAFLEAEAYQGPSLIIAYSHCIAHGIRMDTAMQNHKAAVDAGQWFLYRYHPDRAKQGENPLVLDTRPPRIPVEQYYLMENRFKMLTKSRPEEAKRLFTLAQEDIRQRRAHYEYLAAQSWGDNGKKKTS